MRTYSTTTITLAVLTTLLFAFSAFARDHSALNGTWTLVPARIDTYFYRDITDAENNATIHTGKDLKSKTRWDHDVLKVTTTQSGAVTLESYTLAADGTMMASVLRPEHKPITLVFHRE
jgi:hypothetical protein